MAAKCGIGLDSTTTNSAVVYTCWDDVVKGPTHAKWCGYVGLGLHYAAWLEYGTAALTVVFYGDDGGVQQTGLTGYVWQ